jgi:hypothetical protein
MGESRRCTIKVRKERIHSHLAHGIHRFDVPARSDPGFPLARLESPPQFDTQQFIDNADKAIALVAGQLDIPIHIVAADAFYEFSCRLMELGRDLQHKYPGFEAKRIFPGASAARLTGLLRALGDAKYREEVITTVQDVRFVNVLCEQIIGRTRCTLE